MEVTERISPSWSSIHRLTWPHGGKLITYAPDVSQAIDETTDISVIMQKRVPRNYGAMTPLCRNAEIVAAYHPSCATAWNWLDHCEALMKDLTFKNAFSKTTTIPGKTKLLT